MKISAQYFDRYRKRLNVIANYLSIISLGLLVVGVLFHVTMRYVFGAPLAWGEELATLLMLIVVLAGVPWLFDTDGHLRIGAIRDFLTAKKRAILDMVVHFFAILFMAVWLWYVVLRFIPLFQRQLSWYHLPAPQWPFSLFIALILAMSILAILNSFVRVIAQYFSLRESELASVHEGASSTIQDKQV